MPAKNFVFLGASLGALILFAATLGCGRPTAKEPGNDPAHPIAREQQERGKGHGHSGQGHPAHGPNGGHLIETPDHQYVIEWLHDDEAGKLSFIIWDHDLEREIPIPAEELAVTTTILGENKDYKIPAVVATDAGSTGNSRFEIVDPGLLTHVTSGAEPAPQLILDIDAKQYRIPIEHFHHD